MLKQSSIFLMFLVSCFVSFANYGQSDLDPTIIVDFSPGPSPSEVESNPLPDMILNPDMGPSVSVPTLSPEAHQQIEVMRNQSLDTKLQLEGLIENQENNTAEYYSLLASYQSQIIHLRNAERLASASYDQVKRAFERARATHEIEKIEVSEDFVNFQIKQNYEQLDQLEKDVSTKTRRLSSVQAQAAIAANIFTDAASFAVNENEVFAASQLASYGKVALDVALDLTPVVGTVKGLIEAASGYSVVRFEKLTTTERVLALASIIPYGSLLKGVRSGLPGLVKAMKSVEDAPRFLSRFGRLDSRAFIELSSDQKLAENLARFVESGVDRSDALFRSIPASRLAQADRLFKSNIGYEEIKQGGRFVDNILGSKESLKIIQNQDPVVGLKVYGDLASVARNSELVKAFEASPESLASFIKESGRLNSKMLTSEALEMQVRLQSPDALELALRGQILDPKVTRIRYPQPSSGLLSMSKPQSIPFRLTKDVSALPISSGLQPNQVAPILTGKLGSEGLSPNLYRVVPDARDVSRASAELSDKALLHFSHSGKGALQYLDSSGQAVRFGRAGDKFVTNLPDLASVNSSFSETFKSITKGEYHAGEIAYQVQRAGQEHAGRWFMPVRPLDPRHAEELADLARHKNFAEQLRTYVFREKVSGYAGKVISPEKPLQIEAGISRGYQFFVPDVAVDDVVFEVVFK